MPPLSADATPVKSLWWLRLVVGSLALAVFFQWFRLSGTTEGGQLLRWDRVVPAGDALQFAQRWEAARVTLLDFHQFPSWNPWQCGGVPLFGDAEAPFPGPVFLLTFFWLPTAVAMNVWLILHLAVGATGAAVLARDEGADEPERWLVAAMVAGSTFFAHHFLWEHLSFAPFCLLPWILLAHRRSLRDARYAVVTGGLFALSVFEGGANPTPMMAVVIGLDALLRLTHAEERSGLLRALPVAITAALLLAAPRLIAIWSVLRGGRSAGTNSDGLTPGELLDAWTQIAEPSGTTHAFGWDEYSAYVGIVPLALGMLGALVVLLERQERKLNLVMFALLVWLAMGSAPRISLYDLLHHLPVLAALRVPSRYLFPATLFLGLMAARGLTFLRTQLPRGPVVVFAELALVLFVVADLGIADHATFRAAHFQPDIDVAIPTGKVSQSLVQRRGSDAQPLAGPTTGVGTVDCYHPQFPVKVSPLLRIGDVPQQWVYPPGAGSIAAAAWTPNEWRLKVQLTAPGRVVLNQNADADWHASLGRITTADGLVAVELPGASAPVEVRVWHRPPAFAVGWVLSALGLVWCVWWWRRSSRLAH
jgi:hypothetical protein